MRHYRDIPRKIYLQPDELAQFRSSNSGRTIKEEYQERNIKKLETETYTPKEETILLTINTSILHY